MSKTGYCVKCREKVQLKDGKVEQLSSKRYALKGVCPKCNTKIVLFIPTPKKEGEGLVDTLINGRKKYSPKVRKILTKVGNQIVTGMTVRRAPVPSLITKFLKVFSTVPYDTLFHLSLVFDTADGSKVLVEKNEVINMDISPSSTADTETMAITGFPANRSITEYLSKAEATMGGKYFSYSANDNNCQDYIAAILTSNGITNPAYLGFVKQETASIFDGNPKLRKLANTVTDIAGRADIALNGEGIVTKGKGKKKKGSAIYNPNGDPRISLQNQIIAENMRRGNLVR